MIPVFDYQEEIKAFVANGLFPGREFGESQAIGFANAEEGLVAGFVYHNYEPEISVLELSAYSSRRDWVTRKFVQLIFDYPFEQLGIRMLFGRHSECNQRVRGIWKRLGAKEVRLPEFRGPDHDEIVSLLKAESWRASQFNMRKVE